MKIKLLIMVLLVMATALAPYPRAKADGLCPPNNCYDLNIACANGGGWPNLPVPTGETCHTLPSHDSYTIAIAYCYYPTTGQEGGGECYW
jgi:hypothetical protein